MKLIKSCNAGIISIRFVICAKKVAVLKKNTHKID